MRGVLSIVLLGTALLRAEQPLIHQDFEKDASGWIAFGNNAQVRIAHETALVKAGSGSLELDFDAVASKPGLAILRVPSGLAGARSFRFWIMADAATAEALVLTEKSGSRYSAIFWLEPGTWQKVELTPEDFILGRDPGDPPDPDGQLDLNEIETVALVDLSQIINAAMIASGAPVAVLAHTGFHTIVVDEFEINATSPGWYQPRAALTIDTFVHPQLNWFTFGVGDLSLDATGRVTPGQCLRADYEQVPEHYILLSHVLPPVDFRGATHLAFDIASERPAQFLVSFSERLPGARRGPRYSASIDVVGGGKVEHRQVAISGFEPDEDGPKDSDGKLDLDNLASLSFVDITAADPDVEESAVNTIHLANLVMVKTTALPKLRYPSGARADP